MSESANFPSWYTAPEHVMQFFAYEHLPPHLQEVSKPFGDLARSLHELLPANDERTKAFDALLVAKDAAVRALVAKKPVGPVHNSEGMTEDEAKLQDAKMW